MAASLFFFSEVWASLNKLLRGGHEPWQPPSSNGIHVKKKAKMRHTWRSALVLYRLSNYFGRIGSRKSKRVSTTSGSTVNKNRKTRVFGAAQNHICLYTKYL